MSSDSMEEGPLQKASLVYLPLAFIHLVSGTGLLVTGGLILTDQRISNPLYFADVFVAGALLLVATIVAGCVPIKGNSGSNGKMIDVLCLMSAHQVVYGLLLIACASGIVMIGIYTFSICGENCFTGNIRIYAIAIMVLFSVGLITAILGLCLFCHFSKHMRIPRHSGRGRVGTEGTSHRPNVTAVHDVSFLKYHSRHIKHSQDTQYSNTAYPSTSPTAMYSGNPPDIHPPPNYYAPAMNRARPPIYPNRNAFR
ncbi:hypothetical protein CHS0354_024692 [Potamilus streckersoni]|uniref:Uncharacterized protein n=1 Tax=Potamilus streckersoni TaxID=2493646 RepID=A0AAE0VLJ5_9BIVA|nr:hypothetical protein CHS0354_024692 [Potamilus streckersoni]